MDYIPKFFQPYELVPKETYERFENSLYRIWWMFDSRVLFTADVIRQRYGKMVANTWFWGGIHQFRGWRPGDCGVGAEFSQHKNGRALDLIPIETTAKKIREDIKKGDDLLLKYITCIEEGEFINWLHFDCRNHKGLLIVTP